MKKKLKTILRAIAFFLTPLMYNPRPPAGIRKTDTARTTPRRLSEKGATSPKSNMNAI